MKRRLMFTAGLLLLATQAAATPWIDNRGRSTSFFYPGSKPLALSAGAHSLGDGASAFKKVCLTGTFDAATIRSAAEGLGWGLTYRSQMMPFKDPVDIGGWEASDAALYASNGLFFNRNAQCNLTISPSSPATLSDIQAAMTAVVGTAPANVAKAVDKKGKPNRWFEPEWNVSLADGSPAVVYARLSPTIRGAVQLAVMKKAAK